MKVFELRKIGETKLKEAGIDDFVWDAKELLFYVLGIDMNNFLLNSHDEVSKEDEDKYLEFIERRASHVPLQHITNEQEFYGLKFYVNENVLVPRFDTENLVEEVIRNIPENAFILDVCTGSGCILLSVLKNKSTARGIGLDLSPAALEVSRKNAENLNLLDRAEFREGDLFSPLKDEKFDLIVSNPPYIRTDVIEGLSVEVKEHDPMMALDGGEDGLIFYRRITSESDKYLKRGGKLFFEIGYDQSSDVMKIMEDNGFYDVAMVRDYANNPRIVFGTKG